MKRPRSTLEPWLSDEAGRTGADGIVIDHLADGVEAAGVHTRIATLLVEAGLVARAVLVDHALWVDARRDALDHTTLTVLAAWRWVARVGWWWWLVLALGERIANERRRATAHGTVIDGLTDGAEAAHARTRVDTLVVDAGAVARTIRTDHALRTTAGRGRRALEARKAFAGGRAGYHAADGVGATW